MARLPTAADFGQRPTPQSRGPISADRSGEIIAQGLGQAGEVIGKLSEQQFERRDRFTYAQAQSNLLTADLKARAELANDPDWATAEQRYRETMTKAVAEQSGLIQNNYDRAAFTTESRLDVLRGAIQVQGMARDKEVTAGRATLESGIAAMRESFFAAKDAGTRAAAIRVTQDMIGATRDRGYINPDEAQKMNRGVAQDFAEGYADTLDARPRVGYLSAKEGSIADFIPADRRAQMLRAAQREVDAENDAALIQARMEMGYHIDDMNADAARGVQVGQSNRPSEATLVALYGQAHGHHVYENMQAWQGAAGTIGDLHQMPSDQIAAEVTKALNAPGAIGQDTARIIIGTANQINDAREKDAGGYLVQFDPTVKKAWTNVAQNPNAYFSAVAAGKERLKIASNAVLPDAYVQEITDRVTAPQSAEAMVATLEGEAAHWGDNWADVYGQLAEKLPDTAAVIASGSMPRKAQVSLASMANLKKTELDAMLQPGLTSKQVEDKVATELSQMTRSFPPDAARMTGAIQDSAYRLALSYMNQGEGLENAVSHAREALVDYSYNMVEHRGMALRLPKNLDADTVTSGADGYLSRYFVATPKDVLIPAESQMRPDEYLADYEANVKARGYWVTRPDAKGLRLYESGGPVLSNGVAFDVTWEQLMFITPPTPVPTEHLSRSEMK